MATRPLMQPRTRGNPTVLPSTKARQLTPTHLAEKRKRSPHIGDAEGPGRVFVHIAARASLLGLLLPVSPATGSATSIAPMEARHA